MLTVMKVVLLLLLTSLHGVHSTTIYDARLSGGYSGTVQVLTHLGWQDLCSPSWSTYRSSEESRVLCRQLGYDVTSFNPSTSYFTSSAASTYFNSFSCSGTESEISECNYNLYSEQTSCSSYAVSVTCRLCTHGSVQLRGGVVPEAGTVEYCVSGTWKAVCDTNWDYKEAFVVCRQLGFPATGAIAYSNSYFGHHSLPSNIYFNCFGNESSLSSCQSSTTTCNFANTAGVYCKGDVISEICLDGHVQLVGGKDTREGRVEVCSNGVWGTIFYTNWDIRDATVACKQLGLHQPYSRVEAFLYNYFGAGTGPILYAYLNCAGTESTLADCSASLSPLHYGSNHIYDAGVRCNKAVTATRSDCSNGDVRLVNGTTPSEGRVEICYNGVWGSVCDSSWDDRDAAIVCLQLNYQGTNVTALRGSYFGSGRGPYYLSGVGCSGEERTLLQCGHTAGYNQILTCTPGHDAGVRCDASICTHGDVRLFGGYTNHDGVAEVCINGFWSDICYSGVSDRTTLARIFCRQFTGIETSPVWSPCCPSAQRRNTGNLTLYSITCNDQSGSFIQDCSYSTISGYSSGICNLQNELIIACYEQTNCTNGDIRLRGGNSTFEGRVELCSQGLWGSIVAVYSYYWDYLDARVVCRQLGYPWEWAIDVRTTLFGKSNTRHVARDFQCTGTERNLTDCSYNSISNYNFESYTSAGVICQGNTSAPTQCEHGEVRLVGGQKTMEGRVEICAYGYWATACHDDWGTVETDIVCNQLSFPTEGSEYVSESYFGANYKLPIVRVSCSSGYTNISQCNVYNQTSGCNHRNEIGLVCQERKQYNIALIADQQSYNIGSQVTLNCTINHDDRKVTFYRWSSAFYGAVTSSSSTFTPTIPAYFLNSIVYYCQPLNGGRILGMQRITLDIKGLLEGKINGTNVTTIQVRQQDTIHLQVEPEKANILNGLLGLTWYHNGSVVAPTDVQRYISSNNKTLTIVNFTSNYSGVYKVQFDQLFVHPFDENCQDEVLSLLRHLPVLRPVVFCVNMEGTCPDEQLITSVRTISIENEYSALKGTLNNITLKANGKLLSRKELKHSSIWWYRNGQQVYSSLSLQKHYNNFSLSQEFQIFNITYEQSGRYEVLLRIYMYGYLRDHTCWPYYNRFVSTYLGSQYVTIARGYVDVGFYKGLTFDLDSDKVAAHRDDGATLTCRASIGFPPFSTISFIKDGEIVATSTSGQLQIDTKSVNANPFGLYVCQLNASGVTFNRTIFIKEQANIKITTDAGNTTLCSGQDVSHNYSYVRNYFELNGKVYLNNSVLSLTDIGEGESALFCKTDKAECCGTRPNRFGEFYYPNGVKVPIEKLQEAFYRSRGEQHIRLNRREEGDPTTGMYSCEIPNADDVLVKIYITLVQE